VTALTGSERGAAARAAAPRQALAIRRRLVQAAVSPEGVEVAR
jgi:hypothetical protein